MMKNNKGLIIALICISVAMVGVITAIVLTGVFSKDKEKDDSRRKIQEKTWFINEKFHFSFS